MSSAPPPSDCPSSPPPRIDLWPDGHGQAPWHQNVGGGGQACTAFAVGAAAYWLTLRRDGADPGIPDFPFLYNNEAFVTDGVVRFMRRHDRGGHPEPLGAFNIRAAARVASVFGVPFLPHDTPYERLRFQFTEAPSYERFDAACARRFVFQQLFPPPMVDPNDGEVRLHAPQADSRHGVLRATLAAGRPVVVGYVIPRDLSISKAGDLAPMSPISDDEPPSHAVLVVGYDDAAQRFRFRNSLGPEWGAGGYGTIPYDRIDSRAATFGFVCLHPTDARIRPRVMFRSLTIRNDAGAADVEVMAFDGVRRFLGSVRRHVPAGTSHVATPVRWLDTYRLEVVVTATEPGGPCPRGLTLRVDDPDGAVASHATIAIPAQPTAPLCGRLDGLADRPLPTECVPHLPGEHPELPTQRP